MTAADWALLIPAIVAILGVIGNYLKARAHAKDPTAHLK